MNERQKTVVAAAMLAAAVGVYVELSYHEKEDAALRAKSLAPDAAPLSSVPRPPASSGKVEAAPAQSRIGSPPK